MAPSLKNFNNCQEFAIVNLILSLYQYYYLKKNGHKMPPTRVIQSQLTKDSINSIARYISFDPNMTFKIKMMKD